MPDSYPVSEPLDYAALAQHLGQVTSSVLPTAEQGAGLTTLPPAAQQDYQALTSMENVPSYIVGGQPRLFIDDGPDYGMPEPIQTSKVRQQIDAEDSERGAVVHRYGGVSG